VVLGGKVNRRPFLLGFIAGAFTVVVIALVVLKYSGRVESERSNGGAESQPEFPSFFVSDSALKAKASHEVVLQIVGHENEKGVAATRYCIAFSDARWACGITDRAGKTPPIYADQGARFEVYSDVGALEIWNSHVQDETIKVSKPNCSQLPHGPGSDAVDRFQCEGL
jgi:hypothetical protein